MTEEERCCCCGDSAAKTDAGYLLHCEWCLRPVCFGCLEAIRVGRDDIAEICEDCYNGPEPVKKRKKAQVTQ